MSLRRSLRAHTAGTRAQESDTNMTRRSTRLNRAADSALLITISRLSSTPSEEEQRSICLVIKMPSSKLRAVTGGGSRSKRNVFTEDPIMTGPRTSRPKKRLVEVNTSDEEGLSDQEEDEIDDEDAPGDDEEDADADADADGDLDMDDAPPQPPSRRHARISAAATPSRKGVKGVEAKEMELENDEDDDEELSDLDSDAEGEPDDTAQLEEEDEVDEEGLDSDDPGADLSKMTKRQRGSLGNDFLQLPMGKCYLCGVSLHFLTPK